MKRGHPLEDIDWRRRGRGALAWCHRAWRGDLRRGCRGCASLRPDRVPSLRRRGLCGAGAQLLARRFAGPGARIDVTNHAEPFLGFGLGGEKTHVQPEALTTLFEATAHEESKALELGQVRLRERHRRR